MTNEEIMRLAAGLRYEVAQLRAALVPRPEYEDRHRRLTVISGAAVALTIIVALLGLGFWLLQNDVANDRERQRVRTASAICEAINDRSLAPMRSVLELARTNASRVLLPPGLDAAQIRHHEDQRQRAAEFYAEAIALAEPIDCPSIVADQAAAFKGGNT